MSDESKRDGSHPGPQKGKRVDLPADAHRSNAVSDDETYGVLRAENRVVMRHNIALNLESFAAATEEFDPRPHRTYPSLQSVRPPFFSVIVPNHNGHRHLCTLFDALATQTFTDFEVIFADDASSDDSVAFVEEEYGDRIDLRLLVHRRNLGFAASVNAAADVARGRVLVLLNNDTEPEPSWLAELARAVCAHPDAAVVASKLLLFDRRDRLHTTGDLMGADGIPRNRGAWELDRGQYDDALEIFGGCGGAMAIRRSVWDALGGVDEEFWMYLEDVDFAYRAQLLGWRAVFAPAARVYHKVSSSGGDALASYYVGRNTIWTLAKNMPASLLMRNLPSILTAQIRIATDAVRNLRGQAARRRLAGQIAGLLGLPGQLRKRQRIQPRRWQTDDVIADRLV